MPAIAPLLVPRESLCCFVRCAHVDPNGYEFQQATCDIGADALLLVGRDPRVEHVTDDALRASLEAVRDEHKRRTVSLRVEARGRDTWVSRTQLAVWFDRHRLMVASVGLHDVEVQPWGGGRALLSSWPPQALPQLTSLWLPMTAGASGANLRWRVALAYTGPDAVIAQSIERSASVLSGTPTGSPHRHTRFGTDGPAGGIELGAPKRNVVVERFRAWLDFPARAYFPRESKITAPREDEGPTGAKREDTRHKRLGDVKGVLARSLAYAGGEGPDLVAALVHHGLLKPGDVYRYEDEVDMRLLGELGLLPRM